MKRISLVIIALLSIIGGLVLVPALAHAEVEWTVKKQFNLDVTPLDIEASADGLWLYVLAPEEVLLYSVSDNKVINRIPLAKGFDRLTYSSRDNALIVSSSSQKAIQIIQLELVHKIPISGLPFKGPENAPVTITVFNDYQ